LEVWRQFAGSGWADFSVPHDSLPVAMLGIRR